jgi:transposase-like protein/predicted phosphodiesterase
MTAHLTEDEEKRREEALRKFWAAGMSSTQAAIALGLRPGTLRDWMARKQLRRPLAPPKEAPEVPVPEPREVRDAAFFRKQSNDLRKALDEAEHLAEQLAGIRRTPIEPPAWMLPTSGGHGRSSLIVHTSDWHAGEVVNPGEIEGMNAYGPKIMQERLHRLFSAACEIGMRWMDGAECDGVLLTLGGDLISGDIHEELLRTNALLSNAQVRLVVETAEAGIRLLLGTYRHVHVAAVPGNHGRQTHKSTAKLSAGLSYDILAADMLRDRFRDDPRVTWQIAQGADVRIPLYGRTILVTHGDKMGTGGGQGFAGPVLPIIRGANKVKLQSLSANLGCDLILSGHYHTSAAPPGILANGSVVGYSEFGNQIRAAVEPPKQWLARFSHKWGLCDRLDVQLDDGPKQRLKMKG